jgi:hypothetical protein
LPKLPIEASPVKPKWTSTKNGSQQGWLMEGQGRFYDLCKEVAIDRKSDECQRVEQELLASWKVAPSSKRKRKWSLLEPENQQLNMVVYDESGNAIHEEDSCWDKLLNRCGTGEEEAEVHALFGEV